MVDNATNLYRVPWANFAKAMPAISSSDFEVYTPELSLWAKKETLTSASDLIDKDRQILELQDEVRRLQRVVKTGKVNPSQVKQKKKPCTHCLRAGLGNMYHRVCNPKMRKTALKARDKNREQQQKEHDATKEWRPIPVRRISYAGANAQSKHLCQACLDEGRTVRQARHPNQERCVFKLLNDDGVTDPMKKRDSASRFFKAIREKTPHGYLNAHKRKVQTPVTTDTPPEKRTQMAKARRFSRAKKRAQKVQEVEDPESDGHYSGTDPEEIMGALEQRLVEDS